MIIGIPIDKDSMEANVSANFGRANFFLIHNTESGKNDFLVNTAAQSAGGAGIKAAQMIVDNKVEALISPRLGLNAAEVINSQNIKLFQSIKGTIEDNLKALNENKLSPLNNIHEGFHSSGSRRATMDESEPIKQEPLTGREIGYYDYGTIGRPYGRGVYGRGAGYPRGAGFDRGMGRRNFDFGYGRAMGGRGFGPGFGRDMRGRGFGCRAGFDRGFGCRFGFGRGFVEEPIYRMSEKEWLNEEKALLKDRLNLIEKELDKLKDE